MNKDLKINALLLTFGFSCLVTFAFFAVTCTNISHMYEECYDRELKLQQQIDSLEIELNTFYKNKKDTIIVQMTQQPIRIYNYDSTTRH